MVCSGPDNECRCQRETDADCPIKKGVNVYGEKLALDETIEIKKEELVESKVSEYKDKAHEQFVPGMGLDEYVGLNEPRRLLPNGDNKTSRSRKKNS